MVQLRLTLAVTVIATGMIAGCGPKDTGSVPPAQPPAGVAHDDQQPPLPTNVGDSSEKAVKSGGSPNEPAKQPDATVKTGLTPQDPPFKVSKSGELGWTSSSMKPTALGQRTDAALGALKDTVGEAVLTVISPGKGQAIAKFQIQDARRFRIEYVTLNEVPVTDVMVSDGSKRLRRQNDEWEKQSTPLSQPTAESKLTGFGLVEAWVRYYPRFAFGTLLDGVGTWERFLTALASQDSPFATIVEERTVDTPVGKVRYYRIRAERKPGSAKTLGSCKFEAIFDAQRGLPLTVKMNRKDVKGTEHLEQLSTKYEFHQQVKKADLLVK